MQACAHSHQTGTFLSAPFSFDDDDDHDDDDDEDDEDDEDEDDGDEAFSGGRRIV